MLVAACAPLESAGPLTHWTLQNSDGGKKYEVTVPCTVAGALNEAGALGTDLLEQMRYQEADRTQFDSPWVYTTRFAARKGMRYVLRFEGLNFYADIDLNGRRIAAADTTMGTFHVREFDVTSMVKGKNTLSVRVARAQKGDLNHGYVDWNPRPLDESMGIVRPVYLIETPDVEVQDVFVRPLVNPEDLFQASFRLEATLVNRSDKPVEGKLEARYDSGLIDLPVKLAAGETRTVKIEEAVENPRIWWTREMGAPELYHLDAAFVKDGVVSHRLEVVFGLRDIKSEIDEYGHRLFILNGRKVLIKGAGWTDDIFMQDTPESIAAQLSLVAHMGLNCIRFENIWGKEDTVYDLCDRMGILALVGLSCQWEWEDYCGLPEYKRYGCINDPRSEQMAVRYFHDLLLRMRNHPSVIGWLTGSDRIPNPKLEAEYLKLYEQLEYRPYICSASSMSSLAGPSGVKMTGPYEYVGPDYWWVDKKNGGAFGFNTETGPGLNIPQLESVKKMVGEKDLWPIGDAWHYHCTASSSHMNNTHFQEAVMKGIYGEATGLEDYMKKAHALDYDSVRSMYEAFRCNVPVSTGVVHWMLNSAWPSLYWQLYDWYGNPTAGFYGTRKGTAPIQLVYNFADKCVWAVNDAVSRQEITATLKVYDVNSALVREESKKLVSCERTPVKVFEAIDGPCFVALSLEGGAYAADNFYCVPESGNDYRWEKSDWWGIPFNGYCSLDFVTRLPETQVAMTVAPADGGYAVTLENKGEVIAYQNILKALSPDNDLVPGALWTDNFFTLLPGETKTVSCQLPEGCASARITFSGWNAKQAE